MALASLVVCAEANAVRVLSQILRDLEIEVEHCGEPARAEKRLYERRFDTIVLDCKDEASIQFITTIRKIPLNKSALIVGLVEGREQVRDVFSSNANFVVYKPVTVDRALSSLRAARGLMQREKRASLRVALHAPAAISYANNEDVPATVLDLSESGLSMQSQRRLPQRCKVYFLFNLPGNRSPIRLSGEVVWQDASGRVGLRFADVPQASRRALTEWIRIALAQQKQVEQPDPLDHKDPGSEPRTHAVIGSSISLPASNRRGNSRLACRLSADVFQCGENVPNRCTLTDIGPGGCYVETTEPFDSGTTVEIVVRTEKMKVRVRGIVQAVHPGFGMGVRFSIGTMAEREQVQQLIACQSSEPGIHV
jgi:CheY-like chemotaxis protein